MTLYRRLRAWWLAFARRGRMEGDMDAELRFHLETRAEDLARQGLPRAEARRRAGAEFGGVEAAKDDCRQARGLHLLDNLGQDLRFTWRSLRRDAGFALIAVLILAAGIGANTAVFSVVNTLLLRPLPLPQARRLVWITPPPAKCGLSCETFSADAYQELRAQNRSFEDIGGYFPFGPLKLRLMGHGEPLPVTGLMVTSNFFQVLGVQPALGRLFDAADGRRIGRGRGVVVLANAYWRRQFGSDAGIVGKAIDLNGRYATVIGVLPANFDFGAVFSPGERLDLFAPAALATMQAWGNILSLTGRLKPGVTLVQAQADVNRVAPRLYFNRKYPETKGYYKSIQLVTLKHYVTGRLRAPLLLLWAAVGLILLIVGVNLANLLLARAATRAKEFALRGALGAGRGRLLRQLLTESLALAAVGAALGLGLAEVITRFVAHQSSVALPLLGNVRVDGAAVAWTLLLAAVAVAIFGMVPGLQIAAHNPQDSLKDCGPGMSEGKKHARLRAGLVISEVALACALLVGAGLLLRSFLRVLDVNLGFRPSRAAAIQVDYPDGGSPARRGVVFRRLLSHVQAIPGVQAAGIVDYLPLGPNRDWGPVKAQGQTYGRGQAPEPLVYVATPGFFRAMDIPILAGRGFSWNDGPNNRKVIIINHTLAHALWPNGNAVGQVAAAGPFTAAHVIGVVADVRETSVEKAPGFQIYYSTMQAAPEGATLVVRSALPPATLAPTVVRTLRQLNPNQPAAAFRPLAQIVSHAVSPRRFFLLLVASFGAFALLLTALGIYGVIAYSVTRRTQEIGVRMALGAEPGAIRRMVLAATLRLALAGIAVGLVLAAALAGAMRSLLFGVAPMDPVAFAAAIVVLLAVAALAGYLPARRACRIQPTSALRAN
ncbi:MAG: ADOP family duplicated permease [Terriglobales bacterium]